MLIVKSHATSKGFLGQWIDSFHISLQQVILMLDTILNQVLELFHLDLYYNLIHVGVSTTSCLAHWLRCVLLDCNFITVSVFRCVLYVEN